MVPATLDSVGCEDNLGLQEVRVQEGRGENKVTGAHRACVMEADPASPGMSCPILPREEGRQ